MVGLERIHNDPQRRQEPTRPTLIGTSAITEPGGAPTNTGIIFNTESFPTPTGTGSTTSTASATNSATSAASSTAAPESNGPSGPSATLLVAIIVPIAIVIILIPIAYIAWVRYKTRNMKKLDSEPRYSPSPSKEPKFIQHTSPKHEPKPSFLPPLFHDQEPTKEGSLFDEVRTSMESARRNESTGLFDRTRDDLGKQDSLYGVYALRRSLEDKGRTDSIGLFDLSRNNERPSTSVQQPQRGPSPTLPSPKVPLFDRPPSEAWPLPAAKLPSPQTLYDPHLNTNKPLPTTTSPSSMPPNMPLPRPPGSRHEEQQPLSYASSTLLPGVPSPEYGSGTSRPSNNTQNAFLQPGHANQDPLISPSSVYDSPAFTPATPEAERSRNRHRDSDLVSELSYRSPSTDRDPKRKSTDAMSIVSAISHRKRRSERDTDAMSFISALSPDQEDVPRIPTEHYPHPSH